MALALAVSLADGGIDGGGRFCLRSDAVLLRFGLDR
jgi:hypothetical protein